MHSLSSVSKYLRAALIGCMLLAVAGACAQPSGLAPFAQYTRFVILPQDETDKSDVRWAEYLYNQASRRVSEKNLVSKSGRGKPGSLAIEVCVDRSAPYDYRVRTAGHQVVLTASADDTMLWLVYQWLARMGESDSRWTTDDLDPSILKTDGQGHRFDFAYRSLYTPSRTDPDRIALSAERHVDYHWGLWGHNLRKVFQGEVPAEARAVTKDGKSREQFCFSSEALYDATVDYVLNQYGEGRPESTVWFAVLPDDNSQVCLCDRCRNAGNTARSATPAVTALLRRLAARFPLHQFYTSAYATTEAPPQQRLPDNVGVIISAIHVPLDAAPSAAGDYGAWQEQLQKWQRVCDRIIVWDYMRNFDDYLTPFPCLLSLQNRLQWFKRLGIEGIFYNGSGDDYATFDDVQSYVLSSLLKDTMLDVRKSVYAYFTHCYPQSGRLIADYYWQLEERVAERQSRLGWYEGIGFASDTYLDAEGFCRFYDELDRLSKQVSGPERTRLNQLLTGLNFTRLELMRSGRSDDCRYREYVELLKGYQAFPHFSKYKEAHGLLSDYITSWNTFTEQASLQRNNTTHGLAVTDLSGRKIAGQLVDGRYGFPHDYHTHWYLSAKAETGFRITLEAGMPKRLVFSFLHAPVWNIGLPATIEVMAGGEPVARWERKDGPVADFTVNRIELKIEKQLPVAPLTIKITRGDLNKIACDEIEWYE